MHDTAEQLFLAEITYIIDVILFLLLFASYYLASEKKFVEHQKVVRYMVLFQTIVNINMVYSYFFSYYGSNFTVHAIIGTFIYLLILYTFFLMENKLPSKLRIPKKYQKQLMAITSVLWGIAIVTGIVSYMLIVD